MTDRPSPRRGYVRIAVMAADPPIHLAADIDIRSMASKDVTHPWRYKQTTPCRIFLCTPPGVPLSLGAEVTPQNADAVVTRALESWYVHPAATSAA